MTISPAKIQFNQQGTPIASDFDDVYFSNHNGMEETHYVFLQNNALPQRWETASGAYFTIGETGFGTGLNFLIAWQAFDQFRQANPQHPLKRLCFVSTEKFPIQTDDLKTALSHWPSLAPYALALIQQYPPALSGCHRMCFNDGQVTLDLWIGDVHQSLPQWSQTASGTIDAWFLDGFAPSKNPQMWTEALFNEMARLSHPNTTFATFTAAGVVKRGLRDAGFEVQKQPGFGHKRDMLAGRLLESKSQDAQRLHHRAQARADAGAKVAVIGAGLAGASCAMALVQKGYAVSVYCQEDAVAQGASGNPQGGFYPQLNAEASIASQIQAQSFVFANHVYRSLIEEGFDFEHQWCGVLQVGFNDKVVSRQAKLADAGIWPHRLIHPLTCQQSTTMANVPLPYPGLFIPEGGWINPPSLVKALLKRAAANQQCQVMVSHKLANMQRKGSRWHLQFENNTQVTVDIVVLASGAGHANLEATCDIPWRLVRGQVEKIPSQGVLTELKTVLCHKGYLTPAFEGHHALGSTYVKEDTQTDYREDEQTVNLAMQGKALAHCAWAQELHAQNLGRAATRCSTPDHIPVCGAVPDLKTQRQEYADLYKALPEHHYPIAANVENLYVLGGLGSRGLTSAPLMAEVLASQIAGEPLPLGKTLLNALNPNRFLVRELIRRQGHTPLEK